MAEKMKLLTVSTDPTRLHNLTVSAQHNGWDLTVIDNLIGRVTARR